MKIALIVWELNITGGTQRQALELAVNLQKLGHTVDVFCYAYHPEKCYPALCHELNIISMDRTESPARRRSASRWHIPIIGPILTLASKYFFVLTDILVPDPLMRAFKKRIEHHQPLAQYDVINIHDYQVYKMSRLITHPRMVWMMNDVQTSPIESKNVLHRKLFNTLLRLLARIETRRIATVTVLDHRNKRLCKETYGKEAIVVRSGVDLELFAGIERHARTSGMPWHIFASSIFFRHRRFEDLVAAIGILIKRGIVNLSVTINGITTRAPQYHRAIQQQITDEGLGNYITIVPGMSERQLKEQYRNSDIYVFPNNNQTWGLAVFEAMLAGCATIVSKGSGAHEVITDKENALLVEPCAPDRIAQAIENLVRDPVLYEKISRNGTKFVQETLSWEKYAHSMLNVFHV